MGNKEIEHTEPDGIPDERELDELWDRFHASIVDSCNKLNLDPSDALLAWSSGLEYVLKLKESGQEYIDRMEN